MKSFLVCEYNPSYFIQGFNLQSEDGQIYSGKAGRNEIVVVPDVDSITKPENMQIIYLGTAEIDSKFRPGDILMIGKDELLDQVFKALDELEKRGIVVSLESDSDSNHIVTIQKDDLKDRIALWRSQQIPFICLLTGEMPDGEGLNTLMTLVRRIVATSVDI